MFSLICTDIKLEIPGIESILSSGNLKEDIEKCSADYFWIIKGNEQLTEETIMELNDKLTKFIPDIMVVSKDIPELKCLNFFRRHNQNNIFKNQYFLNKIIKKTNAIDVNNPMAMNLYFSLVSQKVVLLPITFSVNGILPTENDPAYIIDMYDAAYEKTIVNKREFINDECRLMFAKQNDKLVETQFLFNLTKLMDRRL